MAAITGALIGAGIGAVGTAVNSAIAQGAASSQANSARTAAEQAAAQARGLSKGITDTSFGAANQANNTPQAQQAQAAQGLQAAMANQTAQSNGLGNQSSVFNQLQNVASGQGPNPAQAMLAQATGANTANQAALMAGQRGAGANVGLMARQAAQQGAANQQAAAGQGATLQAQQSLGALNQMGGIAGQQVGQQLAANQNNAATALANQSYAGNNLMNAAGLSAQGAMGAMGAGSSAMNQANQQAANAQQAATNTTTQGIAGATAGFGSALQQGLGSMRSGVDSGDNNGSYTGPGGKIMQAFDQGGKVSTGPKSYVTHHLTQKGTPYMASAGLINFATGGKVPAMVSAGEQYLPPSEAKKVAAGKKDALIAGMKIKGKAIVPGDDYRNDTISKTLQEGGVVIPRSITMGKNPKQEADKFVKAVMSRSRHK